MNNLLCHNEWLDESEQVIPIKPEGCIMIRLCKMIFCGKCFDVMNYTWHLLQAVTVERLAVIHVTGQNYRWLPEVQTAISTNSKRHIILMAEGEPLSGIVGLVNCIRKEPGSAFVRLQCCYFNICMPVKSTTCYLLFSWLLEYEYQCIVLSLHVHMHCVYNKYIYMTSNSGGGEIFRTHSDRHWVLPSLLYNGYGVCFWGVKWPGRGINHPPPSSSEVKGGIELYLYSPSEIHGQF